MTHIDWSDDLLVGIEPIDEQHQRLFDIANDLLTAIDNKEGKAILKTIFDRLKEYTQYHFTAEEMYMHEVGFPDVSAHSAEHAILLTRSNTLWRMIQNDQNISPEGASLFLREWIANHIMQKDMEIKAFVNGAA